MDIRSIVPIKYPIFQGGMAHVASYKLASAVSNAGGLGVIGSGNNDANWVKEQIEQMRLLTDKPFAVNIMLMSPHAKDIAKLVIDEKIKYVTTGAGSPLPYLADWKEAGIKVFPVVASLYHAKKMEAAGVDAIIVEGNEAGGHVGALSTFVLLPYVANNTNIPIIAAGGIAIKKQVEAAYILGASGIQVGTAFLATKEAPIHENYKQLVLDAKESATKVTGREYGHPVRVLKSTLVRNLDILVKENASKEEFEKLTTGSYPKAVFDGNLLEGSFMGGDSSILINEIKTVEELIKDLFEK